MHYDALLYSYSSDISISEIYPLKAIQTACIEERLHKTGAHQTTEMEQVKLHSEVLVGIAKNIVYTMMIKRKFKCLEYISSIISNIKYANHNNSAW